MLSHCFGIYLNKYSPQFRWLMVDQLGKYLPPGKYLLIIIIDKAYSYL